jgi:hypothetical protein
VWQIVFHDAFDTEFEEFSLAVQTTLYKHLRLLQELGPRLSRPRVDTLNGSIFANMKELRFDAEARGLARGFRLRS